MTRVMPKPAQPAQPAKPSSAKLKLRLPVLNNEPAALRALREAELASFEAGGFPTSKTEEWRFTSVTPIKDTPFIPASEVEPVSLSAEDIAPLLLDTDPSAAADQLVFVNGRFSPTLSKLPSQHGVRVWTFTQLALENPTLLLKLLNAETLHSDPFTTLNLALMDSGAIVVIDENIKATKPMHWLFIAVNPPHQNSEADKQDSRPWMSHSRNIIAMANGSEAKFIEHYAALPLAESVQEAYQPTYWNNAVTQITLGDNALAEHYVIAQESDQARSIATLIAKVGAHSHLASHTALLDGLLLRNNIHVELRGEHADATVNGLFIGKNKQTLDNHMRIIHGSPNCNSRQLYKGILADHSHGVFTGRIIVEQDAQHTDAKQTNRNLVLNDTARIHTNPQLEIYADDVKCTHGATTGQLDLEALFYLQSRGIPLIEARAMLVHAFAYESLGRMTLEPVRLRLEQLLALSLNEIDSSQE